MGGGSHQQLAANAKANDALFDSSIHTALLDYLYPAKIPVHLYVPGLADLYPSKIRVHLYVPGLVGRFGLKNSWFSYGNSC